MKRIIGFCFCFVTVLLFSNNPIAQAAEKKGTAKTYYAHLQELEKKEKKLDEEAVTTLDLNDAFEQIYKMWDDELNTVYKKLKSSLSKKEFKKLQQEQRKWITDKEKEVEKVKKQWAFGSGETYNALSKAAGITKKRVYELTEALYGKNPDSLVPEKSKTKTKTLLQNKVYSYDLDQDGKKEKVKYTVIENDDNKQNNMEVILYINDKERYRKKIDYAIFAQYTIADIDEADGYLDLFLMATSDSYCLEYAAFQQYQTDKIKTLTSSLSNNSLNFLKGYEIEEVDGKGNFKAVIDTPFNLEAIGCYYCYIPFEMKNGRVKQKKVSTYALVSCIENFKYIPKQEIKVYEKANLSSKLLRTVKKGKYISIFKIKVDSDSDHLKENSPISGYAYIEDKNGKKGWIYLDKKFNYENPLFKEIPAWG